jgi:hypothetical protein
MDYISRKTTKYAGSADRFVLGLWCATVVSSVDCVLISIPIEWLGLTSFMVRIDLDSHLMFDTEGCAFILVREKPRMVLL